MLFFIFYSSKNSEKKVSQQY